MFLLAGPRSDALKKGRDGASACCAVGLKLRSSQPYEQHGSGASQTVHPCTYLPDHYLPYSFANLRLAVLEALARGKFLDIREPYKSENKSHHLSQLPTCSKGCRAQLREPSDPYMSSLVAASTKSYKYVRRFDKHHSARRRGGPLNRPCGIIPAIDVRTGGIVRFLTSSRRDDVERLP